MRKSKYTKELLQEAVKVSKSYANVLDHFNIKKTGGNYQHIKSKIKNFDIDTSHFTGKLWSKGLTSKDHVSIKKQKDKTSYNLSYLRKGTYIRSKTLNKLYLSTGVEYKCVNGHIAEWMGKPLTLHLDHIDGDRTNNEISNLRFLCPNCHQQTETWGNTIK